MFRIIALIALAGTPLVAAAQTAPEPVYYAPGAEIHAELSLMERSRAGGRHTPIFDHYRPDITFDGADSVQCEFFTGISGGHKPGTTSPMRLVCPVAATEGQGFTVYERNRKVGEGVVTARPAR